MKCYYNENDPKAAAWLRELIKAGVIAHGEVDERSILEIKPAELKRYVQCHFFAGIGGWSYALRLAGWNDDRPVWTGSCPCQPFSVAGKGLAEKDERHLWPVWRELIRARHPATIFGEQVASEAGRKWLAGVFADVEAMEYQRAGADLCAASVRAPQRRQRLFWMAVSASWLSSYGKLQRGGKHGQWTENGSISRLGNSNGSGRREHGRSIAIPSEQFASELRGNIGRLGDTESGRCGVERDASLEQSSRHIERADWSRFDIIPCRDGKARRIESGTFPLVNGLPGRVGLLRGYGNAIVPQIAAEFIIAAQEALTERAA